MLRGAETGRRDLPGAGTRLEPVALALEGVGGQVDAPAALENGLPVERDAVHMCFGEEADQRLGLVAAAAQRRGGEGILERLVREGREHAVGAHLEELRDAC